MPNGAWYLVVANYVNGTTQIETFRQNVAALNAYAAAEADHRHDTTVEVVLIASDDETSLRRSYPHLFGARRASKGDALEMLGHVAYA